jgi:hypothetical protein
LPASGEPDVVQAAVVAQGQLAVGIHPVVADAVVPADQRGAAGGGFGAGLVGLLRGLAVHGPVRGRGVVVVAEGVELALQLGQGPGAGPVW